MHLLQKIVLQVEENVITEPVFFLFFFLLGHLKRIAYLLFGCLTAKFGPLSRGQPLLPNVNHCAALTKAWADCSFHQSKQ